MNPWHVILVVLLLFGNTCSWAATPVMLESGKDHYSLGPYLDILEDKAGQWTIGDVSSSKLESSWKPSQKETPGFSFTKSVYWVRFDLQHGVEVQKEWFLEIGVPRLDRIDLYQPSAEGNWLITKNGNIIPFSQREFKNRFFLFRLHKPLPESQRFYLRIQSETAIILPMTIWSSVAWTNHLEESNYGLGLYYGIILVMLFYNLSLFASLRELAYLYYVLHILAFCLFQLSMDGLAYKYLWPDYPWWGNNAVPFFLSLFGIFAAQFSRSFLKTKTYIPMWDSVYIFGMFLFAGSIGLMFMVSLEIVILFLFLLHVTGSAGLVWTALLCLKKGYAPARYYLMAFTVNIAGGIIYALRSFGVLATSFLTDNAFDITSAMQVTLFSLGLADRINQDRKEKYIAQQETLAVQAKILETQQESFRQLQKLDQLKDEFLASTSRQLRTPLNEIIGLSESLLGVYDEKSNEILNFAFKSPSDLFKTSLIEKMKSQDAELESHIPTQEDFEQMTMAFNQIINAIKEAAKLIVSTKNYIDNILYSMMDTLIVFNPDGTIRTVNPMTLNLLGYSENELIGKRHDEIIEGYETRQFLHTPLMDLIQKEVIQGLEVVYRTRTGDRIPMLLSGSVMSDREGQMDGIVCVAQNITDRKKAEISLRQTIEHLLAANRQIQETQSQLVQSAKLASIGELATGIAHELNQPLAYLRNISQLRIQMGPEALSPELAYETFAEFVDQTDRMRKIINHLRDFARQSPKFFEPVDLHAVLENSFTLLNEQLRHRNIEVIYELAESLPEISGNASQLEQVFINLLSNARDALEGVEQARLTIQSVFQPQSAGPGQVLMRFRDNGCGIPESNLTSIFDPFFTTKEVGRGTGLGLSISYGIIQEHGGSIRVSSEEGKGSEFELTFPCRDNTNQNES
ncbi:MAG: PAS domain S-box protein [SAR324 cluster bacterium]|nr:PAS domain S-box protein [SAR324 cluster bacterium]